MCSFESVSYRLGAIVESDLPTASSAISVEDVKTTRTIGLNVRERSSDYLKQIKSAVEQVLKHSPGCTDDQIYGIKLEENPIAPRFDPGLIIDFPRVTLRPSIAELNLDIEMRSCLTVCMGGQRSKIWTRCVLRKPETTSEPLNEPAIKAIHSLFKSLATAANEAVRIEYENSFRAVYRKPVTLSYYGKINLLAVDCSGVSAPIERNCSRLMTSMDSKEIADQKLSDALRKITEISLPSHGQDSTMDDAAFTLSEQSDFYPFRGKNGAGSVFVSTTDASEAYLTGIVNANQKALEPGALPTGSGTTAEIAAVLGSAY